MISSPFAIALYPSGVEMAKAHWPRRLAQFRWTFGFSRLFGFPRKAPLHLRRGRMNLGCASMVLVVLFVSLLLVVDIARLNSGQLDMRLYQAALGLDDPAVVAMAARQSFASIVAQGPVDGETFCQFRSVSLVVVAAVLSLKDENVVSRMYIVFRIPYLIVVTAVGVAIFAVYVFIIFNIF